MTVDCGFDSIIVLIDEAAIFSRLWIQASFISDLIWELVFISQLLSAIDIYNIHLKYSIKITSKIQIYYFYY